MIIVEDDPFIAMEMEDLLTSVGASVEGLAASVDAALALLDKTRPDAALLDLNLRGKRVTPVAQALKEAEVPFVLATGYSRSQIDEPLLRDALIVPKPVQRKDLMAALQKLF